MPHLRDHLHDEIDATEQLREEARVLARGLIRDKLRTAMEAARGRTGPEVHDGADIVLGLQILTEEMSQKLAPLTTKAVHIGGQLGKTRTKKAKLV